MSRAERVARLLRALEERVLVLDGAMGTAIQARGLGAADFGGPQYEGCNEHLVLTRPDVVAAIHESYLQAGCDILETDTFGGTPLVLAEYGLADQAHRINLEAARLARGLADRYSTPDRPRFVAGAMGPTTKAISVTGGVTFDELRQHFYVQARALYEGGVDYFLLETCQDTRNIKAGLLAIEQLMAEVPAEERIPVAVSATIEPTGTMLAGQSVEALAAALDHADLLYLGLNCATGPEFMTDHVRSLAALTRFRVACVPNAGLPDEHGHYLETPEMLASTLAHFGRQGWLNLMGGCCGTHAGHIAALVAVARELVPRRPPTVRRSMLSGIDYLEVTDDQRPVLVGERTNVIGSRKFKELISQERYEEAAEIARAQVKGGAQVIDICLANPDRNELEDMRRFLEAVIRKVRVPLMIDSTDPVVIEVALTYSQGKAIINSVNLEDGEERFARVVPLARRYGAALVVGTIDDDPKQGMGVTRERKLAIARREYELLTRKYRVPPEDIYWDPLVFPCATGDEQYVGSAVETIEAVRLLKREFPGTRTILGISNVSFGLPPAGREVLNSVFLYHCVQAGLDLAIVNTERLERYPSIPPEERRLAEDLLWNRGPDPVGAFAAHFRERRAKPTTGRPALPLAERLARYIVEGSRDGLIEDLDEALKTMKPLEIINGPLMAGMDEVGRLFNNNELIVAEVLQSAEAMKLAVSYLEPFMDRAEVATRGRVILATVKGDVHDIGKNLVEIILRNNGFEVVNLGIKVPPEQLIAAVREHRPDIIGLSGLLVKSAQQMVTTAEDLARAGIRLPLLVGGAALSRSFVDRQIAPAYAGGLVAYARDAMQGLELAKQIVDPEGRQRLAEELARQRAAADAAPRPQAPAAAAESRRSREVPVVSDPPPVPDFERHVLTSTPVDELWAYVNPRMLYGKHLGVKGAGLRLLDAGRRPSPRAADEDERRAAAVVAAVDELKAELRATRTVMRPRAVYRFFRAASEGNVLHLYPSDGEPGRAQPLASFEFPRQPRPEGLCLADFVNPVGTPGVDTVCLFVTTAGEGVRELAETLKARGEYLKAHILQALAIETAEAYAEWLHAKIRGLWGFPDPPAMTMKARFQARYRGRRYSFGYPACPRLDDQAILFALLEPADIGVRLTEGFMMDPEASVSALVVHHPAAVYFSVEAPGGRAAAAGEGETGPA
ncbi:MAG TPA: methionine synthase [Thermodesulfobacteriota bacterium]|nr:methionine synthase [Thermodesulfobacteriota bacterium]